MRGQQAPGLHPGVQIDPSTITYFRLIPPDAGHHLDIGCGAQSQWVAVNGDAWLIGIDVHDRGWGHPDSWPTRAMALQMSGERLDFTDASFDRVTARVSLCYMRPQLAIPEIARVLKPDGWVFLTCHDAPSVWRHLLVAFRKRQFIDVIYRSYVLLNGLWAALGGNPVPFVTGKCEWWQTASGMKRRLERAGLRDVQSHARPGRLPMRKEPDGREVPVEYRPWIVTASRQGT